MPFFSAIGLTVFLIVLRILMHPVFAEIEHTAIALMQGAQISIAAATSLAASLGTVSLPIQ